MKSPSELGEGWGQAVAQRSPRLGGVVLLLLGGALFGFGSGFDRAVLVIVSSLPLGFGAWIAATGRTWKVPDDKPPTWWKAGFVITTGAFVLMSYAYVFAGGAGGI
jgi:hypothetical protein